MQKLVDDLARGAGAIGEVEFGVLDSVLDEAAAVVLLVIQTDDKADVATLENGHVVLGSEAGEAESVGEFSWELNGKIL